VFCTRYLDSIVAENLGRVLCQHLEAVVGDADGQGLDLDAASVVLHDHLLAVHPAAQDPLAAVEEVDTVVLDVEADQIAALIRVTSGRCYDHNFLRFLPISGVFLKNQCYDHNFWKN
jgi:hypothetical protein